MSIHLTIKNKNRSNSKNRNARGDIALVIVAGDMILWLETMAWLGCGLELSERGL